MYRNPYPRQELDLSDVRTVAILGVLISSDRSNLHHSVKGVGGRCRTDDDRHFKKFTRAVLDPITFLDDAGAI